MDVRTEEPAGNDREAALGAGRGELRDVASREPQADQTRVHSGGCERVLRLEYDGLHDGAPEGHVGEHSAEVGVEHAHLPVPRRDRETFGARGHCDPRDAAAQAHDRRRCVGGEAPSPQGAVVDEQLVADQAEGPGLPGRHLGEIGRAHV